MEEGEGGGFAEHQLLAVSSFTLTRFARSNSLRRNFIVAHPEPAHPTHGLLMTLRVLHLEGRSDKLEAIKRGELTFVSPINEAAVKQSLKTICDIVIEAGEAGLARLAEVVANEEDKQSAISTVRSLWEEEMSIARSLLQGLADGEYGA